MSGTLKVVVATLVLVSQLPMSSQTQAPRIIVVGELANNAPYALRLTVRSLGQERVRLYTSDLPWGNFSSIVLVGVTASGQRLVREGPLDDPDTATTDLHPGESVTGVIDLKGAFPRLADVAATEEVLILWSYRLVTMSGERSARTGGGCSLSESTVQCWNGV
jgi:hypothetical protein